MKRDSVTKSTIINLQAHGYKIIDSNILQRMLNEQKLQISEKCKQTNRDV